jgi:hypothetical protein
VVVNVSQTKDKLAKQPNSNEFKRISLIKHQEKNATS